MKFIFGIIFVFSNNITRVKIDVELNKPVYSNNDSQLNNAKNENNGNNAKNGNIANQINPNQNSKKYDEDIFS